MDQATVGVDLGTTNTVVAYRHDGATRLLGFQQQVAPGRVEVRDALPSFLYCATSAELSSTEASPWLVGEFARVRGAEVPGRGIASSKSWLTHTAVDRTSPLLPWSAAEDVPKVSPAEAAQRLLSEVSRAWSAQNGSSLAECSVVLTVPASFDPVARHLTLQAALGAGLRVRLLEEPLAALYGYLRVAGTATLQALLGARPSATLLVCDVGGGTTDLSLVRFRLEDGQLALQRTAVGPHLLLGGDNVDLALAHLAEARFAAGKLASAQLAQLLESCRLVKERLLGPSAPSHAHVTVATRSAALLTNSHVARFERAEVEDLLLNGFLPLVELAPLPAPPRRALQSFGLPYERQPAITRHVAAFIEQHNREEPLAALLLNGGLFNCEHARARMLEVVRSWGFPELQLLEGDPNSAVALGALEYGERVASGGSRVMAGTARSYYLRVLESNGEEAAVCMLPRGSAEGERHRAGTATFELVAGRPVRVELLTHPHAHHNPGEKIPLTSEFLRVAQVATRVNAEEEDSVRVRVEGELSAAGSLDLECVEVDGRGRRFELFFDLSGCAAVGTDTEAPRRLADSLWRAACQSVDNVFGKGDSSVSPRASKDLLRDLERVLGPRRSWSLVTLRGLADRLLTKDRAKARKRSVEHERSYWHLLGFCLRPGFGYVGDVERVQIASRLLEDGVLYLEATRNWEQFWIAWRRLAPGLNEEIQTALRDWVDPYLAPADARIPRRKGVKPQGLPQMWDLAAFLERVPQARRLELGRWLLERTWTERDPNLWVLIAQLGARVPVYASLHYVLPPRVVEKWIEHLSGERWPEVPTAARAAVRLARLTGDRQRDVSEDWRGRIAGRLSALPGGAELVKLVKEVVPVDVVEQVDQFGEELPIGLMWLATNESTEES